jgi:hypothetical protein
MAKSADKFDYNKVNNDYFIPEKTKKYQSLLGKFKLLKFKKKITILFSNIELYDSVEIYIKDVFLPKIRSRLFKEIFARFQELQNILGDGNCLYNSTSMICFNTQRQNFSRVNI